jgi:hypothetical protein
VNKLGSDQPLAALGQFAGYALGMAIALAATIVGAGAYLITYWVFIADLF